LNKIRKKQSTGRKLPEQVLAASKVLVCRTGDASLLWEFLKWKTGSDKNDLGRWAGELAMWKGGAGDELRDIYGKAEANNKLQRAAALVSKFTSEHALHKWVHHQNVSLGICPATALVIQELPKHGLQGDSRSSAASHRSHRSSLQFLRRWRKRWGIHQGKIQIGEDLDSKELVLKVDSSACLLTVKFFFRGKDVFPFSKSCGHMYEVGMNFCGQLRRRTLYRMQYRDKADCVVLATEIE